MRNVLAKVPKGPRRWSPPRSAPSSPSPPRPLVREQVDAVATMLGPQFPGRWPRCCATPGRRSPRSPTSPRRTGARSGPPTRSSGSTARSSAAPTSSGSSPTPSRVARLAACVLIEAHDEWQAADRRYLSEASMAQLSAPAVRGGQASGPVAELVAAADPCSARQARRRDESPSRNHQRGMNRTGNGEGQSAPRRRRRRARRRPRDETRS